ncbi:MAG: 3-deoxy-D-manno-octulosonic acid transferase [Crocinitomicaceae bacterium]|nr:3-deoxy-D-manno-octulosonic acid transferase [Crocinitomicaceae bacterium]
MPFGLYWFHCASLGEFEQGRPLIEALKQKENCQIAVSFFSPSGYEIRKNYDLADVIFYLPKDSKKNAKKVFDLIKPDAVFFVKYEFWANYIFEAQNRKIPFYSVAAVFRKNQIFFKGYGGFMRSVLKACTTIFVQHESSKKLLNEIGIDSIISGDTRYDRVMKNAEKVQRFEKIDAFVNDKKVFVCGSLWKPDLEVVSDGLKNLGSDWKIILTTHEIDEAHLTEAENYFGGKKIVRYSNLTDQNSEADILLIDNVGMLMHVYGYANLAYVGGAFKTGLHNILEPASFGLPVIFGPNHQKFPEAKLFIENGIGFSVSDSVKFKNVLTDLQKENHQEKVLQFMNSQRGATEKILKRIF